MRIPYFYDIRFVLLLFFSSSSSSFFTALPVTLLNSATYSVKFDPKTEANYKRATTKKKSLFELSTNY